MKRKTSDDKMLDAYEAGEFKSVSPSRAELSKFRDAARVTFIKDRRINVRLSSPDLMDLQARAAEEGVPYQTLITSVLHKFVSGRFQETASRLTTRASARSKKRRAA